MIIRSIVATLLAGVFLLLTACAPASVKVGSSYGPDSKDALILVRTTSGNQHQTVRFAKQNPETLALIRYTGISFKHPDGYPLNGENGLGESLAVAARAPIGFFDPKDIGDAPRYHLLPLEPGRYILASIETRSAYSHSTYKYTKGTFFFDARPGEVLALGSISMQIPLTFAGLPAGDALTLPVSPFKADLTKEIAEDVVRRFGDIQAPIRQYKPQTTPYTD